MVKARTPDKEHLLANLQQRIYHIEQFVTARLNAKDDPAAMVRICHALLEQQDVESALRVSAGRTRAGASPGRTRFVTGMAIKPIT